MIELALIGMGSGHPDHLTRAAERALAAADLVLVPRKAEAPALAALRRALCARLLRAGARIVEFDLPRRDPDGAYLAEVAAWHAAIAGLWRTHLAEGLPAGGRAALLIWGDPALYDSSLRIAARTAAAGLALRVRVVPGISSLQLLTAAHAIPLNPLAGPVLITTGRRLRAEGWPDGVDSLAVMLDGDCAFETVRARPVTIWWGAYLGLAEESLLAGPLDRLGPEIRARRAALRAERGWIMDIYLMRRGADLSLA
ncbi:precorrin-6A synthase (deacetylating) [Sphingomonas morindae]|uniref:Precorrin-6A synthase [deacetylating] n=1 Tax=Sphingomonas morindae TaxID=1541170 RepID=A0ABY4X6K5_9SPHN|nr:precorrin-6A synthase (deacetylating) [Sphingomonas morindae]USI72553.1 precorrin-6A synthase (deacetylating) [Sphingomonas morindae]